jgi:hypothetical protein
MVAVYTIVAGYQAKVFGNARPQDSIEMTAAD